MTATPQPWSNARMDKHARIEKAQRALLPPVESTVGVYLVRWLDDEAGWKTTRVIARATHGAIGTVTDLIGHQPCMEAFLVQAAA